MRSPNVKCLDVNQILRTSTITNIWRTVRRIYMFILGLKVLTFHSKCLPFLSGSLLSALCSVAKCYTELLIFPIQSPLPIWETCFLPLSVSYNVQCRRCLVSHLGEGYLKEQWACLIPDLEDCTVISEQWTNVQAKQCLGPYCSHSRLPIF